jgi:hypothetical protein
MPVLASDEARQLLGSIDTSRSKGCVTAPSSV